MSYKDRIETNWAFRIQLPIGSHVPFHCTASGKTFMASLPKAERRRLVNVMKLDRMTANTIVDPDALLAELARVARQGYAIDDEEFMDGMVAIAVPVFDTGGKYAAALAFHGPVQRMSIADAIARADDLRQAARDLETVMFN
jgi:DNA-binding IclR family transcriptional regulator